MLDWHIWRLYVCLLFRKLLLPLLPVLGAQIMSVTRDRDRMLKMLIIYRPFDKSTPHIVTIFLSLRGRTDSSPGLAFCCWA